jgi:cytochrome c5
MSLNRMSCLLAALAMLPLASFADEAQSVESGRAVYQSVCIACHAPENVMVSAPKAGDAAEWARRAGKGPAALDMLTKHAIDGFGAMPAKGGHAELTAAQIRDAIVFMRASPVAAPNAPAGTTR